MKKILIVEDDRNIADILEIKLRADGYKALIAYTGKEGWEKANSEKPDLIVLDIGLPVLNGIELCALIKKRDALRDTPVIMLTAKKTIGDYDDSFAAGADVYLNKPYKWEELLAAIEHLLEK